MAKQGLDTFFKNAAVLIPALNPDSALLIFAENLKKNFCNIIVVDDGSTEDGKIFEKLRADGITVLSHKSNLGKGAAIKTGLKYIKDSLPGIECTVTADADGQHDPEDVCNIAAHSLANPDRLIVGERTLSSGHPWVSRFGNAWAKAWFRMLTRIPVNDTQTGLRGIPESLFDSLLKLPGRRYEYETYMLVASRRHPKMPLCVPIRTIYNDNNSSSHFRRIRDSLRTNFALWLAVFRT